MKSSRIKVNLPMLTSRDDAEAAMHDLAAVLNNQRLFTARRDAEVLAINKKYEGNLAQCEQEAAALTDQLRAWSEAHPDQFPKGRKSLDLVSGVLGFRTGTPKLALLSRAWNWDKVLAQLKQMANRFVRTKEEVDKEAILAEHAGFTDKQAAADLLKLWGVKVTQDESFFIEPRLTALETRQTMEAQ